MPRPRKLRIEFRKNRSGRQRGGDLTRAIGNDPDRLADQAAGERLSGKGDLTRKRTVMVDEVPDGPVDGMAAAVRGMKALLSEARHGLATGG
jgi:ribosome biogenesis GTPase